MERDSLFSETTMQKMKKTRKAFLWTAVWLLIGELALGAILILTQSWNVSIGKIMGMFLILTVVLFVGVNNFIRLEKGNKAIQVFALICLVSNMIWAVLASLLLWEVVPFHWTEMGMIEGFFGGMYETTVYHMTFWSMAMAVAVYAAVASFWISNVMAIKERVGAVKPLKITAIVCVLYTWVFNTVTVLAEIEFEDAKNLYELSFLADLAFVITALAALIVSVANKKKDGVQGKTEAELRMEIEEKVRQEMATKEVRGQVLTAQAPAEQTETGEQANTTGQVVTGEKVVESASAVTQTASQPGHTGQAVTEQMPVEQQVVTTEQVMAEQKVPEQVGGDGGGTEGAKRENAIIEESFGNKGN